MTTGNQTRPQSPLVHLADEFLESADKETLFRLTKTFLRIEEIIDSVYDLNHLLELTMQECERAVDAETGSLLLYDSDANELYFEVALGPKGDEIKEVRLPLDGISIAATAAQTREPVNIPNAREDPRWNKDVDDKTSFMTRSILAVPMLRKDRLIGIVEVLNKKPDGAFTDEDIKVLSVLTSLAAISIENAQLYEKNVHAERLAALGTAVAGVSHYVKNVLTGLRGSIALIESSVRDKEYDILGRATLVLKRSYGRIEDMVKDILSFSKGSESKPTAGDPREVIQEIFDLMLETAASKGIELKTQLPDDVPRLLFDREILERVLLNLVTNGMEAIYEQTHVDYEIEGELTMACAYEEGALTATVKDNGVGIPPSDLSKVWTPFYTTKGSSGTGLGLAVSRKLVEDVGGTLVLESTLGEGTTFRLKMPVTEIGEDECFSDDDFLL